MMRTIIIAALAALSFNSYAIEYTPDTDVDYDIIQMHDTTTWEKVCETFDGVCDVPNGTYQVKLLDLNWNELVRLRGVSVQHSSSQDPSGDDGVHAPDLTAELCALYQVLDDQSLLGSLSVPTFCSTVYSLGDTGPGGGIVFHVTNGGLHGLEAAPGDLGIAPWCSADINIEGVDDIVSEATPDSNSGEHNTPLIEATCGASSAAGVAAAYVWPNGQSDGFLPNKEEFDLLYDQRTVVGGFVWNHLYWTSSEQNLIVAWIKDFIDGSHSRSSKSSQWDVRAIRIF